jgi:hypothetical protein
MTVAREPSDSLQIQKRLEHSEPHTLGMTFSISQTKRVQLNTRFTLSKPVATVFILATPHS